MKSSGAPLSLVEAILRWSILSTSLFAATQLPAQFTPTNYEQYVLQVTNRARANPAAEVARLSNVAGSRWGGTVPQATPGLNEGLSPGTISSAAKQPLAFNVHLIQSSRNYSAYMLSVNGFGHTVDGNNPSQRMAAAGYVFSGSWGWGENIAWSGSTGPFSITTAVVEFQYDDLFIDGNEPGRGHRVNLLDPDFKEIGIGITAGGSYNGGAGGRVYNAAIMTMDFAYITENSFLTGVVFQDTDGDNFYTPGEGLGGVTISAVPVAGGSPLSTTTWQSGGYTLQLPPNTYDVTASGSFGTQSLGTAVISTQNVALDFKTTAPSSVATLSGLILSTGNLSPAFNSATLSYATSVPYAITSTTVTPTATQPLATVTVNGTNVSSGTASDAINLNVGSNVMRVLVTAHDGTTERTYTVNVTRAQPAPEIEVEQPVGTGLVDGTATKNFGTVATGTIVPLTFTVKNAGTASLTGLAITKNGTNAADFAVGALGATTLAPDVATTFTVMFSPTGAGVRTAAIHIASNDADENPFDINLNGTGVLAPEIVVQQPALTDLVDGSATIDYQNTSVDNPSTKTFIIKNTGLASLTGLSGITIDGTDAGLFSVTASPAATLAGGASTTFMVRFAPTTVGPKTAVLHIVNNDADENPFDITLVGTGTPGAGSLALDGTEFTVNETDGTVTIPIKRSGGSYGAVTVKVSTTNGTAIAPGDYTALTNVPVTLPDGMLSGSTTVSIVNSPTARANRTLTVTLSSPTGGATLGTTVSAPVTIVDSTSLSNATDAAAPSPPVITTPAAGALVNLNTGVTLNVTGTATDNKGVKQVRVALNNGVFADAALGTPGAPSTTFTFSLPAVSGLNTIQVKSTDYASHDSSIVTRSFTVLQPLTVNVNATLGSVSAGSSPSSFRQAGQSLSITATPKPPTTTPAFTGSIFAGWTLAGIDTANGGIPFTPQRIGVATSALEKPTLSFIFREGLVLTANFVANPFAIKDASGLTLGANSAGTSGVDYNGLIHANLLLPSPGGTPPNNSTEGLLTATVTNTGAFSAKLTIDGSVLNMAGAFDQNGVARFGTSRATTMAVARVNKPSLVVALAIDLGSVRTKDTISGTVTATSFQRSTLVTVSNVTADRAFYDGLTPATTVPVAYLGAAKATQAYTVVLPSRDNTSLGLITQDYPQGTGYGFLTISKAGLVTLTSGMLADGAAVSGSSKLSKENKFPLFLQLYNKLGYLSGDVQLDSTNFTSDLAAANMDWFRPLDIASQYYPFGWPEVIAVGFEGARYAPTFTPATSVLRIADGVDVDLIGEALLPVDQVNGNAGLSFLAGQLTEELDRTVSISTTNAVTKVPANDTSFSLTLTAATGLFSGTFIHENDQGVPIPLTTPYQGVIYQKGTGAGGFGYFLTRKPTPIDYTGESGGVRLNGQP